MTIDVGDPHVLAASILFVIGLASCVFVTAFRRVLNSSRLSDGSYDGDNVFVATLAAIAGVLFFPITVLVLISLCGQQRK